MILGPEGSTFVLELERDGEVMIVEGTRGKRMIEACEKACPACGRAVSAPVRPAAERRSPSTWIPPSSPQNTLSLAYLLLPCAQLSKMQPQVRKAAVSRRTVGAGDHAQGSSGEGDGEAWLLAADSGKQAPEDLERYRIVSYPPPRALAC